jgi:hypothetical protein
VTLVTTPHKVPSGRWGLSDRGASLRAGVKAPVYTSRFGVEAKARQKRDYAEEEITRGNMPVRWARRLAFASRASLRCMSLAAAFTIASIFGAPSAFASPLDKAAGAVGAVDPPVIGNPGPSLPRPAPPPPPAPPVKPPTVEAPETRPSSPRPVPAPASGSTKASTSTPGVDLPSAYDPTRGAKEPAGLAPGTSTKAAQQTPASARGGAGKGLDGPGAARPRSGAGAVESAKPASPGRFLARIWPAMALGPVEKLFAALQAPWEAATSLPISDVPSFLSGLAEVTGASHAVGPAERSRSSNPPQDSTGIWVPDGAQISVFVLVVVCAALMALFVFTLRRELRSMHRWHL